MANGNTEGLSLDTMGGFVYFHLDKILKQSSKSRDKELRSAAVDVQKRIFMAFQKDRNAARKDKDADKYFLPFKLACNHDRPNLKMLHTSLDAIQRMIAYGYLSGGSVVDPAVYPPIDLNAQNTRGDKKDSKKTRRRKLIDVLVETIYMCSTTIDDDQVQIQVIKTLITAVQSKTCHVHDHSVLLAVRSCYHIYLTARNTSNQTTARAILTQMLNVVFRRMEHFAQQLQKAKKNAPPKTIKVSMISDKEATGDDAGDADANGAETPSAAKQPANGDASTGNVVGEIVQKIVDTVAGEEDGSERKADEQKKDETGESNEGTDQGDKSKPLPNLQKPPALTDRPLPKTPVAADGTTAEEHQDVVRKISLKLNVLQNDAYLLFRALTQLSMKKIPESIDPVAIKSKALALELLLSVLQNSGPMLRTHPKFVGFIKDKLVRSLLQNCVSSIPRIYKMAAPMFLALVAQFKPQMKFEIGVILTNIFLSMLASPMSSYMQKSMAVVILLKLCKDPQTIVELFLNFDCDISSEDKIFENIIIQLEKVAQGRFMSEALMSPQNEQSLRLNALEALGHVMTSLTKWCAVLKDEQRKMAMRERKEQIADVDDASQSDTTTERTPNKPAFSAQFNLQRERRMLFERAILLFNRKPKKGIKFLVDNKLLEQDPASVAEFLKSHKKLNKTQIGEYMGEDKEFNKKVLYKYIEDMDFSGMQFDEALRHFLKGFRLPGEGQKIDRMVVKFADQYTNNNPFDKGGKFRTADGAYVLAYATIMLHTDLHNPGVKNKMSKEQFINMNRGIDDGNDIDPTFMSHLYDKIQQEEIHMTGENAPSEWANAAALHPRKRQTLFMKQTENLIKKTENLIRHKPRYKRKSMASISAVTTAAQTPTEKKEQGAAENNSQPVSREEKGNGGAKIHAALQEIVDGDTDAEEEWYDAKRADLESLQPMFDILWCPAFATFSLVLKENDESHVAKLCLENYRSAVHLSSLFQMDTPRDAFIKSLQHFSLLGTAKPLTYKNVEAIKMMLHIAYTEGDYLKDSWGVILQCISEYDKLMRRSPASQTSVDVFDSTSSTRESKRSRKSVSGTQKKASQVLHSNAEILREQLDPALVDRVFTHSAHLSSDAIVDFVRNLSQVSQTEVYTMNETPRVFSLQKIVEITYYNMNRIRLVWTRIWNVLSAYFAKAGCHPNLQVSLYSIDSLRQLAMKFLEKDELAHYHFQKQFLKPFEVIMANTKAQESKALIIQCISRMVLGRVANVRSGWKSVFGVLRTAAADAEQNLVSSAFALMERIMLNYFTLISNNLAECVTTLGTFAENKFTTISLKAVDYIEKCAGFLATVENKSKEQDKPKPDAKEEKNGQLERQTSSEDISSSTSYFPTWMILLQSCRNLVLDSRAPLQNRALEMLFDLLTKHGDVFTVSNWEAIFHKVLFPIFNGVGAEAMPTPRPHPPKTPPPPGAKAVVEPKRASVLNVGAKWLRNMCLKTMAKVVQLFAQYQLKINGLLPDLLALITSCISQGNLELAYIGITCWRQLMQLAGEKFDNDNWTLVLKTLHSLFEQTLPHELQAPRLRKSLGLPAKSPRGAERQKSKSAAANQPNGAPQRPTSKAQEKALIQTDLLGQSRVMAKCTVHKQILDASYVVFEMYYKKLTEEHIELMLLALNSTIEFLSVFNSDTDLRRKLHESGFRNKKGGVFDLIEEEVEAYAYLLKMLQIMYIGSNPNFNDSKSAEVRLRSMGKKVFVRYKDASENKGSGDLKSLSSLVCTLVDGFGKYSEEQLKTDMPTFFPDMLELIETGNLPVRRSIAQFIKKKLTPLLPFKIPTESD